MKTESEKHRVTVFNSVMKYMSVAMAALYVATGVAILWDASWLFNTPRHYGLPLGSIMIVYGVFRGYRTFQKHYQK